MAVKVGNSWVSEAAQFRDELVKLEDLLVTKKD